MVDVERQLRAYGDAVEGASPNPSPEPARRRGVFRGTLVAAAVVVLALAAVGAVLVARRSDDGRTRTTSTRPRTRHVAPITATVRLDAKVVRQGDDILGTVTLRNPGNAPALLQNGCSLGLHVEFGGIHPYEGYGGCGRFVAPPGAYVRPGRSVVRFALPTVGRVPRRTRLWVAGTRTTTTVTIVANGTRPRACTAADLALTDAGPLSAQPIVSVRHIVTANQGPTACRLDGAPVLEAGGLPNAAGAVPPPRHRVHGPIVLQPGGRASVLIQVSPPTGFSCTSVPHILRMMLPDGGGQLGLQLSDPTLDCVVAEPLTNFVAGDQVGASLLHGLGIEPALSATVILDHKVIHRGEDVVGTVVLTNRTAQPVVVGSNPQCRNAWTVHVGSPNVIELQQQELLCIVGEPTVADRSLIPPGRTRIRFASPTTQARTSTVSVHVPRTVPSVATPATHFRWAPAFTNPAFCAAATMRARDAGEVTRPAAAPGTVVHRLVLDNTGRHTCALLGLPGVEFAGGDGAAMPAGRRGRPVVLRPGGSTSVTVRVTVLAGDVCNRVDVSIRSLDVLLPNQGGAVPVALTRAAGDSWCQVLAVGAVHATPGAKA